MSIFDLSGKVALITGAAGGIGTEICRAMRKCGATIIAAGRDEAELASLASSLGEPIFTIPADLADPASAGKLVSAALAHAGRLDILVNNAGLTRDGLALRMKDEEWQSVIDINLTAAFRLTREALAPMVKARAGRIISISSIVGVMGNAGQANYAASKAGLIGMTKSVAAEVAARGICVNAIAPGFIATPMTDGLPDEVKAAMLSTIPAKRFGLPAEIAAAVVFLSSDESAYITGQTLHVNGGQLRV